jgi:1,4-dihydroxy-6-naphthoate synthase
VAPAAPTQATAIPARSSERTIRLGHSPDPDDAFMHYAVSKGLVDTRGLEFVELHRDIETLNEWAAEGLLEATAVSIHAYAHLADRYQLLSHGASMGEGYGPMVVAKTALSHDQLRRSRIAVPGLKTSAFLELQLALGDFDHEVVMFDEIPQAVAEGRFDAGLLIHEGQLTFQELGLRNVLDLYQWWAAETGGLPLPLGGNAIRRDLGPDTIRNASLVLRESILWALDERNREEALEYALGFGRGLDHTTADEFVAMYVNPRTIDYGTDGRDAVQRLLDLGFESGHLPRAVTVDWVDDGWSP